MKGKYWFNSEPISKHVDIVFEYEEYQFINEVVQLCSIDELKEIINSIKKHVKDLRTYSFVKEYIGIHIALAHCSIEYNLPGQSYTCCISCNKLAEILERYVYKYEHLDDWFK